MRRGLSYSDADWVVSGAARSLDWRGRKNRCLGSSLASRKRSGGRVKYGVRHGSCADSRCARGQLGASTHRTILISPTLRHRRRANRECVGEKLHIKHPTRVPTTCSVSHYPPTSPSASSTYPPPPVTVFTLADVVDAPPVDQAPPSVLGHPVNLSDFIFIPGSAHLVGRTFLSNPVLVLASGFFYCPFRV